MMVGLCIERSIDNAHRFRDFEGGRGPLCHSTEYSSRRRRHMLRSRGPQILLPVSFVPSLPQAADIIRTRTGPELRLSSSTHLIQPHSSQFKNSGT